MSCNPEKTGLVSMQEYGRLLNHFLMAGNEKV